MIAGLELPTSGAIRLAGEDVTFKRASRARHRLRVPALRALSAHERAPQHRVSAAQHRHARGPRSRARVAEAARILRIEHLLDRSVSGLSSGDRQRVALGRAIVREPAAFMMDEPLGALDAEFRHLMCGELRALHDRLKATTVYVTHDQLEAMAMADRIAVMNEGVIEQFGPPQEIYDRPATLFVADFIGSPPMNFLAFAGALARGDRTIRVGERSAAGARAARGPAPRATSSSASRPEHVRLSDDGWLRGEVYGSEYLGTTQIVTVRTARGQVRARLPPTRRVAPRRAGRPRAEARQALALRRGDRPRDPHGLPRREAAPMAEDRARAASPSVQGRRGRRRPVADDRRRRVRRAARADGRRQDDDAAPRRRARARRRRRDPHRRRRP